MKQENIELEGEVSMPGQDDQIDFIGREREITLYEEWLNHPEKPSILYFHDASLEDDKKGGIGKTWLLRKFQELTRQRYPDKAIVMVDFFNVEDRNGIVIAERVIDQLKSVHPHWSPEASEMILREYRDTRKNLTDDPDLPRSLADAITRDLTSLDGELQKTGRYLLLFYDTFEIIEDDPGVALLNPTQKFPDNYQFAHIGVVMAGRNALPFHDPTSYWYEREQEVQDVAIGPFVRQEMIDYINLKKDAILATQVSDSEKMARLLELTEGRPILIGLAMDIVNSGILTLDDLLRELPHNPYPFQEGLVSKIIDLQQPINLIILFMAHAYHRFNAAILNWVLQESDLFQRIPGVTYQNLSQKLPALSFVRRANTGDDFVLHDEMRHLVVHYCWQKEDPFKKNRIDISSYMIKYYEKAIVQTQNKIMTHSYMVEMLYHKLFVNLNDGLLFFEQIFENELSLWSRSYARALLQEAKRCEDLSPSQHYRLYVLEARLLAREEKPGLALELYQYLQDEAKSDWFEQNCSTIYWGMADCFEDMGDFSAAIEYALKSLEIEKLTDNKERQAELLGGTLGYICRRQGQFDEAVDYYKQALEIYEQIGNQREYADKMNSLGNVYRIQGKIDEAMRHCLDALRIRKDLLQEGKAGELQIALSLGTIGQIYLDQNNVSQAEKCFQRASVIFQRAGYRRGIARTYNRLGQVHEMQGNLDRAMEYFQDAYQAAMNIDKEEQISSLNKQGSVLMRKKSLVRARELFAEAVELSETAQDHYQQVQSLLNLAHAFEDSHMHDQAQHTLAHGRELAEKYRFYSLLGAVENFQGEAGYESKDYDTAFTHFVQSCHYMALFNSLRYEEAIDVLIERLRKIPKNSQPAILSMIRTYWSERDLNAVYPELIAALDALELIDF